MLKYTGKEVKELNEKDLIEYFNMIIEIVFQKNRVAQSKKAWRKDLEQEAFIRMWKNKDLLIDEKNAYNFLYTIAYKEIFWRTRSFSNIVGTKKLFTTQIPFRDDPDI